ncbi:hypothetical protein HYT55_00095 [Candidatus Woesearchaeota archaeon]|nr:hypothetical protein [Candidatus Woesearchaeota archaeon]
MISYKQLLFLMLVLVLIPGVLAGTVSRSFDKADVSVGGTVTISLAVAVAQGDNYYAIEEPIPSGWSVVDQGKAKIKEGKLSWIQLDPASSTLQYSLKAPNVAETADFSTGRYKFKSTDAWAPIGGSTSVTVGMGSGSKLANEQACQADGDCQSGHCADPLTGTTKICCPTNQCNFAPEDPVCSSEGEKYAEAYFSLGIGNKQCTGGVWQSIGSFCGDKVKDNNEECDITGVGPDFGGTTCQSKGYNGGTLKCSNQCTLDASGCTGAPAGVTVTADDQHQADLFTKIKEALVTYPDNVLKQVSSVAGVFKCYFDSGCNLKDHPVK